MNLSKKMSRVGAAVVIGGFSLSAAFSGAGHAQVDAEKVAVKAQAFSPEAYAYVNSRMGLIVSKDVPLQKRYEAWDQVYKIFRQPSYKAVFDHLRLDEKTFYGLGQSVGKPLIEQTLLQASTDLWEHKNDYNQRRAEAALKRITDAESIQATLQLTDSRLGYYKNLLEDFMREHNARGASRNAPSLNNH